MTQLYDYMVPEARIALGELTALGVDPDLAIACLEALCGEETLYDIPVTPQELNEQVA